MEVAIQHTRPGAEGTRFTIPNAAAAHASLDVALLAKLDELTRDLRAGDAAR
jgi:hypothetical protein